MIQACSALTLNASARRISAHPQPVVRYGKEARSSEAHEIDMKRIDTYDREKSSAILEYSMILGKFAAADFHSIPDESVQAMLSEYSASLERLSLYVAEGTMSAISKLNILENYVFCNDHAPEFTDVRNRLRAEMRSLTLPVQSCAERRPKRISQFASKQFRIFLKSFQESRPCPDPAGEPVNRHEDR